MENENVNTEVVATATTVPTAMAMQVSAHSVGIMFENSVTHQQNQFQQGLSNTVLSFKKLAVKKQKISKELRKSRFDKFNL